MDIRCCRQLRRMFVGMMVLAMFLGMSVQAHASWVKNADGTYSYYRSNGKLLKNRWIGDKYYVDADGVRLTGKQEIESKWYFFTTAGKLYKGKWLTKAGKKYYASKDGSLCADGIHKIGSYSYLFNEDAEMLTGLQTWDGETFFLDPKTGRMLTDCWVKVEEDYYYFGSDGVMAANKWLKQKGYLYYVDSDGRRVSSAWKSDRYLASNGKAYSGLHEIDGDWYYFDAKTYKKTTGTSVEINGETWQFNADGKGSNSDVPAPGAGVQVESTYYTQPVVDDETLLSYIIYCEAGNQPYEGQVAVGYVIMNRVYSKLFRESTIREVVYAKKQFQPTRDGAMERVFKNPSLVTEQCKKAAKKAIKMQSRLEAGNPIYLTFNGKKQSFPYLFFMTPAAYRGLRLTAPCAVIGGHVFFEVWK